MICKPQLTPRKPQRLHSKKTHVIKSRHMYLQIKYTRFSCFYWHACWGLPHSVEGSSGTASPVMCKYPDVGANERLALLQEIWTQDDARPHAQRREWISKETADSNWFKPTQHNPTYAPITKSEHQYEHIPHHSSAPSGGSATSFSNDHGRVENWKLHAIATQRGTAGQPPSQQPIKF